MQDERTPCVYFSKRTDIMDSRTTCSHSLKTKRKPLFLLLGALLCVFVVAWPGDADAIRISLKRVIFGEGKRSEVLSIINSTAQPQTYRLGWRHYRMTEDNSLQAVDPDVKSDDILWADDMVRFAPRRITVPAGASQQIRLLFRRPADLKEGEYRSHLWIVTETKPEKFEMEPGEKKQSVRLAVQPAVSLPIFVRSGDLSVKASISDARLAKTAEGLKLNMVLHREGNRSLYGDFDFICSAGSKDLVVHQVRGISVYTEIAKRQLEFTIPMDTPEKQGCTAIKIVYRADPDDSDFKGAVMAEASAQL